MIRALAACCLALAAPAHAEPHGADYQTEADALGAEERAVMRARIAAEIAAERTRADAAARVEADAAAQAAAARAARPAGERLLEARCLTCHDRPQIDAQSHGAPMWWATVLRMQILNGADLHRGERAVLVAHLSDGRAERTRAEALALMAGVLTTIVLAAVLWRRGSWRRQIRS